MSSYNPADNPFPGVKRSEFHSHVKSIAKTKSFADHMMALDQQTASVPVYTVPRESSNKNRYFNVLPSEKGRVILQKNDSDDCDYINASHIEGIGNKSYICAQAPTKSAFHDFWRMVLEQDVGVIVMLTNFHEKKMIKADRYWPEELKTSTEFGDITVTFDDIDEHDSEIVRVFEVSHPKYGKKMIHHIQLTIWPDHGVPRDFESIEELYTVYRNVLKKTDATGPVLVHCSAGIGRSGTFVTIDTIFDTLLASPGPDTHIDIYDVVAKMRYQRPGSVQTIDQYRFIYEFIDFCLMTRRLGL